VTAASLQDSLSGRLQRRFASLWHGTRLYALTLPRKAPLELPLLPDDPFPGTTANADRLFQGRFVFAGVEIVSPHAAPWSVSADEARLDAASQAAWAAGLHGFGWLRDFAAQGGDMARRMARSLLADWMAKFGTRIHGLPWRADVAGTRLTHWLLAAHFLLDGADERFAHDFLLLVARHRAHLGHAALLAPPGLPRLAALLGLVYGVEALGEGEREGASAMRALCLCLDTQIHADGGHVSRNPSLLLRLLRDLATLWLFLKAVDPERAAALQGYLDRMGPMLRFFRHGDGALALFHGGEEELPAQIDLALDLAESKGKPLSSATQSGYERAVVKRALLLLDAAPPPAGPALPHRGLLAAEFSAGKDRLIVNCGASRRAGGSWAEALSGVAAHSTLTLGSVNQKSGEPSRDATVSVTRNEQDGAIWFEAEHDGWRASHGRLYRRRLYLAASGEDLRGEEIVTESARSTNGGMPVEATLRLHLHPSVHASMIGSGDTVLLKSASGQGWRWRGAGGVVRLEDSVYCGSRDTMATGEPRRTQQIVMAGSAGADPLVFKWALTKIT
jgi:uncharacterized heparinase superfamily protein